LAHGGGRGDVLHHNAKCSNIIASDSNIISWSNAIRYLEVNTVAGHKFACSLDNCKRSFYRAFDAIFGKVGQMAPEDVIIELLKAKFSPALYYGLEACPVNRSQIRSLDMSLTIPLERSSLQNHSMSQLTVYYIFGCAVQDTL